MWGQGHLDHVTAVLEKDRLNTEHVAGALTDICLIWPRLLCAANTSPPPNPYDVRALCHDSSHVVWIPHLADRAHPWLTPRGAEGGREELKDMDPCQQIS